MNNISTITRTEYDFDFTKQVPDASMPRLDVGQMFEKLGRKRMQHSQRKQRCANHLNQSGISHRSIAPKEHSNRRRPRRAQRAPFQPVVEFADESGHGIARMLDRATQINGKPIDPGQHGRARLRPQLCMLVEFGFQEGAQFGKARGLSLVRKFPIRAQSCWCRRLSSITVVCR